MRVFVFLSFLLIVFGVSGNGVAGADSKNLTDLKMENVSNEDNSPELQEMREYMKNQQQKQQEIALLSLDLDEAKIELELRQKKADLGHYMDTGNYPLMAAQKGTIGGDNKLKAGVVSDTNPEVKSVFVTNSYRVAVLDADGSKVTVKEGDNLGGVKVKKIDSNGVTLVRENNEEFKIAVKE